MINLRIPFQLTHQGSKTVKSNKAAAAKRFVIGCKCRGGVISQLEWTTVRRRKGLTDQLRVTRIEHQICIFVHELFLLLGKKASLDSI